MTSRYPDRRVRSWQVEQQLARRLSRKIGEPAVDACFKFDRAIDSIVHAYKSGGYSLDEARHYVAAEADWINQKSETVLTSSLRNRMKNQADFAEKRLLLHAAMQTPSIYEKINTDLFDGTAGIAAAGLERIIEDTDQSTNEFSDWLGSLNEQTALTILNLNGDSASTPHIALPSTMRDDTMRGYDINFFFVDSHELRHVPVSVKSSELSAQYDRDANKLNESRRNIFTLSGLMLGNQNPTFKTAHSLVQLHKGFPGITPHREAQVYNRSRSLIDSIKATNTGDTKTVPYRRRLY